MHLLRPPAGPDAHLTAQVRLTLHRPPHCALPALLSTARLTVHCPPHCALPASLRRPTLAAHYHFLCTCPACTAPPCARHTCAALPCYGHDAELTGLRCPETGCSGCVSPPPGGTLADLASSPAVLDARADLEAVAGGPSAGGGGCVVLPCTGCGRRVSGAVLERLQGALQLGLARYAEGQRMLEEAEVAAMAAAFPRVKAGTSMSGGHDGCSSSSSSGAGLARRGSGSSGVGVACGAANGSAGCPPASPAALAAARAAEAAALQLQAAGQCLSGLLHKHNMLLGQACSTAGRAAQLATQQWVHVGPGSDQDPDPDPVQCTPGPGLARAAASSFISSIRVLRRHYPAQSPQLAAERLQLAHALLQLTRAQVPSSSSTGGGGGGGRGTGSQRLPGLALALALDPAPDGAELEQRFLSQLALAPSREGLDPDPDPDLDSWCGQPGCSSASEGHAGLARHAPPPPPLVAAARHLVVLAQASLLLHFGPQAATSVNRQLDFISL